jgi:diaminohydroxyphosphoribosylaminopyrimidine deaminase/5-amino-6-(5-phosphoribosylamino)uracil reductase
MMSTDENYMWRALQLAKLGGSSVAPNPMVGAVIVHNNKIIGEGYHEKFGGPHAEVNAVNSVKDHSLFKESTIYVTLEPCAHTGKTPPCADLLAYHRFKRVVVATRDPYEEVAGLGISKLRDKGIDVTVGVLQDEALHLNRRFFMLHLEKRPYVFLKWAESADGFIDIDRNGNSAREINWISGKSSQLFTHNSRAKEHAILVGRNTIINDNPSLTTRAFYGKSPIRIILDPQLKSQQEATIFHDGNKTIVINHITEDSSGNIEFIKADFNSAKVILDILYKLQISSVIVEGGAATLQCFINENLWDEALVIKGPTLLESGKSAPKFAAVPVNKRKIENDSHFHFVNQTLH